MATSLLLAQVIGLYLLLEGLVVLTHRKFIVHIVADMGKNRALMSATGAMLTILGLLIVLDHNVWDTTWRVIPTIVGWILLVKGVMIFFVPNVVLRHARTFARNRNMAVAAGIAAVTIGAYLVYVGFGLGA